MKRPLPELEETVRWFLPVIGLLLTFTSPWKLEGIALILSTISFNLTTLLDRYLKN
jgi:hypothetical protein